MKKVKQIGVGKFGPIYMGLRGKEAVKFLMLKEGGEIRGAFFHSEIGSIDLIWDTGGGKGLLSIKKEHPDAVVLLDAMIKSGNIYSKTENRIRLVAYLGDISGTIVIRLDFDGKEKKWVLTAFINKKEGKKAKGGISAAIN